MTIELDEQTLETICAALSIAEQETDNPVYIDVLEFLQKATHI